MEKLIKNEPLDDLINYLNDKLFNITETINTQKIFAKFDKIFGLTINKNELSKIKFFYQNI